MQSQQVTNLIKRTYCVQRTLRIKAVDTSETSANIWQPTLGRIPEDGNFFGKISWWSVIIFPLGLMTQGTTLKILSFKAEGVFPHSP